MIAAVPCSAAIPGEIVNAKSRERQAIEHRYHQTFDQVEEAVAIEPGRSFVGAAVEVASVVDSSEEPEYPVVAAAIEIACIEYQIAASANHAEEGASASVVDGVNPVIESAACA